MLSKESWPWVEKGEASEKTVKRLNDCMDLLERVNEKLLEYVFDREKDHLLDAQKELKEFKKLHKKLNKKKLPYFGKKTVKGNREWYASLAGTYNMLLREEKRKIFLSDNTEDYFFENNEKLFSDF